MKKEINKIIIITIFISICTGVLYKCSGCSVLLKYINISSVLDVRKFPLLCSERVTQVLYNERLYVSKIKGKWARVYLPDQRRNNRYYPGWVIKKNIKPVKEFSYDGGYWVIVNKPYTFLYKLKNNSSYRKKIYFGTYLKYLNTIKNKDNKTIYRIICQSFDGQKGWLYLDDCKVRDAPFVIKNNKLSLIETILLFLDAPYLWGGMTINGIDCSGLTYNIYRFHGYIIPRDADDQFFCGKQIKNNLLQTGDLLFFGHGNHATHVGIFDGSNGYYHSTSSKGVVWQPIFNNKFSKRFIGARRIIENKEY